MTTEKSERLPELVIVPAQMGHDSKKLLSEVRGGLENAGEQCDTREQAAWLWKAADETRLLDLGVLVEEAAKMLCWCLEKREGCHSDCLQWKDCEERARAVLGLIAKKKNEK